MELLRGEVIESELAAQDGSGTRAISRRARAAATSLAEALDRVTMDDRERASASALLVADLDTVTDDRPLTPSEPPMSSHGTRLAHAVARTTLDAWRRGEVDDDDVARAYAALASRVVRVA